MTARLCEIDGCEGRHVARGWCAHHYRRLYRKQGQPRLCEIDGCTKPHLARGMCDMHVSRFYRHGDPLIGASRAGQGSVTEGGYVQIGIKGHPLASPKGDVYLHRAVLYDAIGGGPHGCHWCGVLLSWTPATGCERLVVDHLDRNKLNNVRSNLVQACQVCNVSRRRFGSARPLAVLA